MTLDKAAEIGYDCGLKTLEEAVNNIDCHAMSMFLYSDINTEMLELEQEANKYDLDLTLIEFLGSDKCKECDDQMRAAMSS